MFRLHAPPPFRSDRSWSFGVPPEQLWERITDVGDYRSWWPWLTTFSTVGGFGSGARWQCVVSPPLPYDVRFAVLLEHVEPARSASARVVGDVTGDAPLEIDPTGPGCTARLRSELAPSHPVLAPGGRRCSTRRRVGTRLGARPGTSSVRGGRAPRRPARSLTVPQAQPPRDHQVRPVSNIWPIRMALPNGSRMPKSMP